jgi:hypothetical protein
VHYLPQQLLTPPPLPWFWVCLSRFRAFRNKGSCFKNAILKKTRKVPRSRGTGLPKGPLKKKKEQKNNPKKQPTDFPFLFFFKVPLASALDMPPHVKPSAEKGQKKPIGHFFLDP